MHEEPNETSQRITAWYALRDAKAGVEEMIAEAARTNDARLSDKLNKWLPVITVAEKHVGNVIADLDTAKWSEIRPIAAKLRQLGKRKTDEIAGKLERASSLLMDA